MDILGIHLNKVAEFHDTSTVVFHTTNGPVHVKLSADNRQLLVAGPDGGTLLVNPTNGADFYTGPSFYTHPIPMEKVPDPWNHPPVVISGDDGGEEKNWTTGKEVVRHRSGTTAFDLASPDPSPLPPTPSSD